MNKYKKLLSLPPEKHKELLDLANKEIDEWTNFRKVLLEIITKT